MAADPIRPLVPPPVEIPALLTGDGWDEVRRRAPGDTGLRLAKQVLAHQAERRGGEVTVMLKFDQQGRWYHTRILPAPIECARDTKGDE